jgi:predicted house-cleaning noncanonical NTP pyrophosphatase (MazG superfamily)
MRNMVKFLCNKLCRDKTAERLSSQNVRVTSKFLTGSALQQALKQKLIEETQEFCDARDNQEMIAELADVLEVIDALRVAFKIDLNEPKKIKAERYAARGGFEQGLYVGTVEMEESNPRVEYFRQSPTKYPEIKSD